MCGPFAPRALDRGGRPWAAGSVGTVDVMTPDALSTLVLSADVVSRIYDRLGRFQDWQVYERRPVEQLVRAARFEEATSVVELGCGTGRLAARLLREHLPANASYLGLDVSARMVGSAARALEPFGARGEARLTDGTIHLPVPDGSVDRVLSVYVLDLLSEEDGRLLVEEAHRVLRPEGLLCLGSLTDGTSPASRVSSAIWRATWSAWPVLVGGCRPIELLDCVDRAAWQIRRRVVTSFTIATELVVAAPI
jgi:ubiquinone/menaquinone biosynthesis C-methylase UbiE